MSGKPTIRQIVEATGKSRTYACDILNGNQPPSIPVALEIYRKLGWKAPNIAHLTGEQIDLVEEAEKLKGQAA